jgi:hypothetical protein
MNANELSITIHDFVSKPSFHDTTRISSDQSLPTISIVIPSFNSGRFLERSILSVLNQNYPRLELIIMDGGSTDNTTEVLRDYTSAITYWRSEKDNGQADALNKAISHCTGDLVGWQNADDVYLPNAFAEIARQYNSNPRCGLFSGNVVGIDEMENVIDASKFTTPTRKRLLYEGFVMSSQAVFWKRELHSKVGIFRADLHHAMDFEFWLRTLGETTCCHTDKFIGGFRKYPGTKTSENGDTGTLEVNKIRSSYGVSPEGLSFEVRRQLLRFHRLLRWLAVGKRNSGIAGASNKRNS